MTTTSIRILVIDDNPAIHDDFRKLFTMSSFEMTGIDEIEARLFKTPVPVKVPGTVKEPVFEVDSAFQGQEGVEKVQESLRLDKPYQVAMVDMRMPPGIDGVETIRAISQLDPDLQFVVCTAYSDHTLQDFLTIENTHDRLLFVKKPFDHIEISLQVRTLGEKWYLAKVAKMKIVKLQEMVEKRTAELQREIEENKVLHAEKEKAQAGMIHSAKLASLGEMAAGVAHEINNPLHIIRGHVDLLRDMVEEGPIDPNAMLKMTDSISKTVDRISRIVTGMMHFSRESDNEDIKRTGIHPILDDALALCQQRLELHGVRLDVHRLPDDVMIHCRHIQIGQVILNLINNAFDAIRELDERWIRLELSVVDSTWVELTVTDSGKGISVDLQHKIMQPFFSTRPVGQGTGLGLSVSLGIAESHGGTLGLDTHSPHTRFVLRLPLSKQGDAK